MLRSKQYSQSLLIIKWGLIIGLAFWAESKGLISKASSNLSQFDLNILLIGWCLISLSLMLGVLRWFCFLKAFKLHLPSFRKGLLFYYIGLFYNTYLPGAVGGDVLRGYGYQKEVKEQSTLAYLIPFGERLMGLMSLGVWFLIGGSSLIQPRYWLMISVSGICILILLVGGIKYAIQKNWKGIRAFKVDTSDHAWSHFGLAFGINLLSHGCSLLIYVLLGSALGIDLEWKQWLFVLSITLFFSHLPLSVAGIGTREVSLISTLKLYEIPSTLALSLSFSVLALLLSQAALGGVLHLIFPLSTHSSEGSEV